MPEQIDSDSLSPHSDPTRGSPYVSVIIPAYNAAAHIGNALESVLAQSFTDCEVMLINDGSSDSEELEKSIQPYLSRITYLKQDNQGPSAARNLGIRHARGEWLAFLDSDDSWLPNYLAEQLRFLWSNPKVDMVYCDATLEGSGAPAGKTFMQICPSTGPVTFESLLFEQTQPITSGTIVRRRNALAAGLFDEAIHCSEDHDLWMRIVYADGKIDYQRRALLRRNVRPSGQGSDRAKLLAGEIQSLIKLNRELDLDHATQALLAQRLRSVQAAHALAEGKRFLLRGEQDKAFESLSRAGAVAPSPRLHAALTCLRIAPRLTVFGARLLLGFRLAFRDVALRDR
jgi:glycosyltransferase involved in cell wall biosynthesis